MRRAYTQRTGMTPAILPGFGLLPPASPASRAAIGRTESHGRPLGIGWTYPRIRLAWREDGSDWSVMLGGELALVSSGTRGGTYIPEAAAATAEPV